ncbi:MULTISPECIES: hypothetical protein [Streptomyces]|uniref:LPXTG cell wall anchor domain-containing protein n=1 Tax=Streptomyces lycii TaxID=2654337 RepID=A0ABQ7FQ36_9ACTN|nr:MULTISPECIES: hypothetical protein [Streptomyces]KAF4409729.1 hypothetical protein GCU69_07515 [Streptomyces lycii]PGH48524.1 hypothetical protein CRI70_22650 [Streptomyces sp. Ru87]
MSARRPLLTAAAAGSVLLALWFVPSANATIDTGAAAARSQAAGDSAAADPGAAGEDRPKAAGEGVDPTLADTGSFDSGPYLLGGTAFLGAGAGLVAVAARRSRAAAF